MPPHIRFLSPGARLYIGQVAEIMKKENVVQRRLGGTL